MSAPTVLTVLGLSYLAMVAVALSMERHQGQLRWSGATRQASRVLRLAGWTLLAVALAPAVLAWGASVGVVGRLGLLTFAALGLGLQLSYAPRSVLWLAPAALVLPALAGLVGG